jgi:hypothetical protein
MEDDILNPATVNGVGPDSRSQIEHVLTFELVKSRFFSGYTERNIWKQGGDHLIAVSPSCFPDEFSDPKCDCRNYFVKDLAEQLNAEKKLNNGSRVCLYGFWNDFERSAKLFKNIKPEMLTRGQYYNMRYWFVIRVQKDLDYIKKTLPAVFDCEISFK